MVSTDKEDSLFIFKRVFSNSKTTFTLNEALQLFPEVQEHASTKLSIARVVAPSCDIFLNPRAVAIKEKWLEGTRSWLANVDFNFLLAVLRGMSKGLNFRILIRDNPDRLEVRKFLKTFAQSPTLPVGLQLFQGQSSWREPVYFKDYSEGTTFTLGNQVNSTSLDPHVPFEFIDKASTWPIMVAYTTVSPDIHGLPIAEIYRELERRGYKECRDRQIYEEEILLSPFVRYSIEKINHEHSYFRYKSQDSFNVIGTKIYQVNLTALPFPDIPVKDVITLI